MRQLLTDQAHGLELRFLGEFQTLHALLRAQSLLGGVSTDLMELISGLGEVWSALMLHAVLEKRTLEKRTLEKRTLEKRIQTRWLDARDILVVDKGELAAMELGDLGCRIPYLRTLLQDLVRNHP